MNEPVIAPAVGLELAPDRTLPSRHGAFVSIVIPAHNEAATVGEVVAAARQGLEVLHADGEVIVSASGCTDATAAAATAAGAAVVHAPIGKGRAICAGVNASRGDVICLLDGDLRYLGASPLAAGLIDPILAGTVDATIADLYHRPVYPHLWLYGFYLPLTGRAFPELLPKAGTTPWSGQRAAVRELWPGTLRPDFTVDLELTLHWNDTGARLRPVIGDDWIGPPRPKPDLIHAEFSLLAGHAVGRGRVPPSQLPGLRRWFGMAHSMMARYKPGADDVVPFEDSLLAESLQALHECLTPTYIQVVAAPDEG
jgi:hypothetical protein